MKILVSALALFAFSASDALAQEFNLWIELQTPFGPLDITRESRSSTRGPFPIEHRLTIRDPTGGVTTFTYKVVDPFEVRDEINRHNPSGIIRR